MSQPEHHSPIDPVEREHLRALLDIHRANERQIERQIAAHGLAPPVYLAHALQHEREAIAGLEARLAEKATSLALRQPRAASHYSTQELHTESTHPLQRSSRNALLRRARPRPIRRVWRTASAHGQRRWTTLAVVLILLAGAVGLGLLRSTGFPSPETPGTLAVTIGVDGARAFGTGSLAAADGQILAVTFNNSGSEQHNWVLVRGGEAEAAQVVAASEAAGPDNGFLPADRSAIVRNTRLLSPGEGEQLTFVAEQGSYMYVCTVPGHYRSGMRGILTVQR